MSVPNSLKDKKPEIANEWHPTKNNDLTPDDVPAQSNLNVWWLDSCGHEWYAKICNRFNGAGCPYCSGRYPIKGVTDLATTNPDLAKEWHPTKNGEMTPSDVKEYSNKKAWWICPKGHEWQAQINSRRTNGCPYCSGKAVLKGFNDLETTFPEIAKQWHPTKNDTKPWLVSKGYDKKVWWICDFGHEWEAPVYQRVAGHGCPICVKGQKSSFSEQAVFYYIHNDFPDAINGDTQYGVEFDIFIPSKKIAIEYDGYKWHSDERTIKKDSEKNSLCNTLNITLFRFREEGCPPLEFNPNVIIIPSRYNDNKTLERAIIDLYLRLGIRCPDINIDRDRIQILEQFTSSRKGKSLSECNPTLAKEWHPTKNGTIQPCSVNIGSQVKYWWLGACGHEWQASVYNRAIGKSCPFCSSEKLLLGFNDLKSQNPKLAEEWNYGKNEALLPENVFLHSNKKVWWKCKKGHEWQAVVCSRVRGIGCPICSGKSVLRGFNDLVTLFPEIAKQWHPTKNDNLQPYDFSKGSHKKVWWKCEKGHEWQAVIKSRVRGSGCPICSGKSVLKGFNDIATVFPEIAKEWHPTKNDNLMPYDFSKGSHKKVWWKCEKGHEWQAEISNRVNGRKCPYCRKSSRKQ